MQLLHYLSHHIEDSAVFEDEKLVVVDEFLSILHNRHKVDVLHTRSGGVWFGAFYHHGVINRLIAGRVGLIGYDLNTLTRYIEA